ncbi:MAG: aminopeptidase P family protein [Candidatus Thorarchaeota archaeon]|nr:aminopeptidase P family protein [Candidatus Thorarchaeota archaeon]
MIEDLDRCLHEEGVDAIVVEGNGFEKPDVYWMTGFRSTDSVIALHPVDEETVVAAGYHTVTRVQRESFVKRTFDLTEVYDRLRAEKKRVLENQDLLYEPFLQAHFSGKVLGVPDHLPVSSVLAIRGLGYDVRVVPYLLKDARARKEPREVKAIQKAADATMYAVGRAVELIKDCDIGPNHQLVHQGRALTVGDIKVVLDTALIEKRAEAAEDSIVAVGKKAFDWHYLGATKDVIKEGEPLIIDVFPRLKEERYIADVTRTVVKGTVSKRVREMFDAVKEAGDASVDALTGGARVDDVNKECYDVLSSHGFDSKFLNPKAEEGMTHGLGHGIGLEVHENPSMYEGEKRFQEGHVMAIEPGVYLRSVGGVRIENDYLVTKGRAKRLTQGLEDVIFV